MWTHRIPGSSSSAAVAPSIIRWSLILAALPSLLCTARFPIEKWECGSDGWTRSLSHDDVMKDCPHFAAEINHCCVVHDHCYGRKKGQKMCDEEFDQCNKKVVEDERAEACAPHVRAWIEILEMMGWFAYHDESNNNYTEPHESQLPQLCRPEKTMGVFFDYLYLSCPTIKKPISSCCDQLSLCPDLPLGRNRTECANRAMHCLAAAHAAEHEGFSGSHCDRALERTRKYLALDYIMEETRGAHAGTTNRQQRGPENFANTNQAFVLLMVLSMLCGVGLLLVTYKYYRLRTEHTTRKYSTITLSTA